MDDKRFAAVICEYNPFHFGHEYQLNKLKSEFYGVVCIMSGDLVQRGGCSVAGKYIRARAAIECGADLVLELPAPWCVSSAADFARAGVHIAANVGAHTLAFGAEGEEQLLRSVASLYDSPDFVCRLSSLASGGGNISYPAAFCAAAGEFLGQDLGAELKKPNNILAVEYLRRIKNTSLKPFVVRREEKFKSASELRALPAGEILNNVPEKAAAVLKIQLGAGFPRDISRLDAYFIAFFRSVADPSALCEAYGMTSDLAHKLVSAAKHAEGFNDLCESCADKKYTAARVRRAAIAAAFGFGASAVKADPPFTLVLAANSKGRELLAKNRNSGFEIITKPAAYLSSPEEVRTAFELNKRASDIAALCAPKPKAVDVGATPYVKNSEE